MLIPNVGDLTGNQMNTSLYKASEDKIRARESKVEVQSSE